MRKFKTKVITDESQVPVGFKRISVLADSLTDQKKLSDAHTDGFIAAVKLMRSTDDRTGPVWVDAEAAQRVLSNDRHVAKGRDAVRGIQPGGNAVADAQVEAAALALCEINNGITIACGLLERLTQAVEIIATQPKQEPVGSWRDMNGESL